MNILLIDDENNFSQKLIELLFEKGHFTIYFDKVIDAYDYIYSERNYDIAIIDLMLPPEFKDEGLYLLEKIRELYSELPIIMISQKNDKMTSIVDRAFSIGINKFLDKNDSMFWIDISNTIKEIEKKMNNKVFISHGHNELLKFKLKDFVQNQLNRVPLILSEMPNNGLTVVEKLENASILCNVAIVLLTKDDETKDGGKRARQNVIHEIGFFQGKYGRNKVILLCEQGVEIFSNISGILRIEFSEDHFEEIYNDLRRELN